ncbi:Lysophospholipase, alpha-beta hydrolase superfamily [Massilia sp. PDC64]|nr:alpha/beta fold hydrolase [Massilia sp. PDC64]SDE73677.1 Lysophospholipase, alpha-beta hydrolase superfamily [Massilia sp. PDC64]
MPLRLPLSACLIALAVLLLVGAAVVWAIGSKLIAVAPRPVALAGPGFEDVLLRAAPDQRVAGSWLPGRGRGAVLLLHGIHGDRRDMADRARFLNAQGYAVLLIDLPGQGASTASFVTFGLREADGVRAALKELRRRAPGQKIGVIGVSLGAASLVLCRDCPPVDAVVLESMYPTIEEAVANRLRMRLGPVGGPLSALLLWQLPLRLGIRPDALHPIKYLGDVKAPVLIAAGSADLHTTLSETQRLYEAAAQPKALWVVEGAAHVNLHAYAREEYERRIGAFLAAHLD